MTKYKSAESAHPLKSDKKRNIFNIRFISILIYIFSLLIIIYILYLVLLFTLFPNNLNFRHFIYAVLLIITTSSVIICYRLETRLFLSTQSEDNEIHIEKPDTPTTLVLSIFFSIFLSVFFVFYLIPVRILESWKNIHSKFLPLNTLLWIFFITFTSKYLFLEFCKRKFLNSLLKTHESETRKAKPKLSVLEELNLKILNFKFDDSNPDHNITCFTLAVFSIENLSEILKHKEFSEKKIIKRCYTLLKEILGESHYLICLDQKKGLFAFHNPEIDPYTMKSIYRYRLRPRIIKIPIKQELLLYFNIGCRILKLNKNEVFEDMNQLIKLIDKEKYV